MTFFHNNMDNKCKIDTKNMPIPMGKCCFPQDLKNGVFPARSINTEGQIYDFFM